MAEAAAQTLTQGAVKAGANGYFFVLDDLQQVEAGKGYSSALGGVVEGQRIQCGLMHKAAGSGARPHSHDNEQWTYVLKGRLRVFIEGEGERVVGPGTLIYLPAGKVHSTVALPDEDVVFFTVKDMTAGIIGKAADGTMAGAHYEPGFAPEKDRFAG